MSETEIWSELAWLESQDAICASYKKLRGRELNTRRCREVTAAARQAREYFYQAALADLSVRPLLTFYGVSSLSRACILLLGQHGGEPCLAAAHGLQSVKWGEILDGDLEAALCKLGALRIKTCSGLYKDLAFHTNNEICIHVDSSAAQCHLNYQVPSDGSKTSLDEMISMIPDLEKEALRCGCEVKYNYVQKCTYDKTSGFKATLRERTPSDIVTHYEALGYTVVSTGNTHEVSASLEVFSKSPLQFAHKRIGAFASIPELYVSERLWEGSSEICMIFKLSYTLGMLARYYPTHWMALINGLKGDKYRAIILQAQRNIEAYYPTLISELITYKLPKTA